jgi:hypothetical protein
VRRHSRNTDLPLETPGPVIGSIALGVGPLPFLIVYSILFIVHGMLYPVSPPDITSTQTGEAVAGWIAFTLFCVGVLTIFWFLGGIRRWPFLVGQLATFITAVDFVFDSTKGSPAVPALLVVTSGTAIVLALLPSSWEYMDHFPPMLPSLRRRRRSPRSAKPGAGASSDDAAAHPVGTAAAGTDVVPAETVTPEPMTPEAVPPEALATSELPR